MSRIKTASHGEVLGEATYIIDKIVSEVQHGTFERSLSGLTAMAALVTTAEIYVEHYRASFGNKMMWSPILVTPPVVVAGIGGIFSRRWAKTWLPLTAGIYTLNGLVGEYYHARGVVVGVVQRPHGAAHPGPRSYDDRGIPGPARRLAPAGALRRCRTSATLAIYPICAQAGWHFTRAGCPASVKARRRK